jgi:glutamine---fructose-6-phosphate transaminase (isomerizing)
MKTTCVRNEPRTARPAVRCGRCLMPASLPGSDFDSQGTCAWCRSGFPDYTPRGVGGLEAVLSKYRGQGRSADCLVGISGGKDSSFVLMELATRFGMRAEAFTYTHAGLVPGALDNARRVCESLNVPHHLVSLPGNEHLDSFRTFFRTWLKRPGILPAALTCVACKHLHLLGSALAVSRGIPLIVWAGSPMEYSPFLSMAVKTAKGGRVVRGSLLSGAARLARGSLLSPVLAGGLRRHFSLCLHGCLAFSPSSPWLRLRHPGLRQLLYFEYCRWEPDRMRGQLISTTGWQLPPAPDDWHSDCTFNVLKEYMFQSMLGASYTDAFLSNQIRKNLLGREAALAALAMSKAYFRRQVHPALERLGLKYLAPGIDLSCFDIPGGSR